jgi:tetratricopeptide (TPR) repeat protein
MTLNESLNIAELAHQQKNYEVAEQAYLKAISQHDSNDATYGLATLYAQTQQYERAISLFTKALAKEPNAVDITLNFAMCLNSANKAEAAYELINNIKEMLPNDRQIINSFAHLALKINQPKLSLEIATKYQNNTSVKSSPQTDIIIAQANMQSENWAAAIAIWLRLSHTLSNQQAVIQKSLSICYAKLRQYDNAVSAFKKFLEHTPVISLNLLKFADLYLLARDVKQARLELNNAIALSDNSLTRYEIEIRICRLENKTELAIAAADNALALNPESYIAWGAKQEIGAQHEHTVASLSHLLESSIENNYQNQQNLFILAKAYEKLAQYPLAFRCFTKANTLQEDIISKSNLSYDHDAANNHHKFLSQVSSTNYSKDITQLPPSNIFIVGMPRSGTTLMDRILSQHPSIESSGENEALALFIENKVNAQKNNTAINWQEFFSKNKQDILSSYRVKTALNADIIVDKMPHNYRYVGAILSIFEQVKVIQMRRAPEDLALSIFSQPFAPHHNYAANLKNIAHAIFQANKLMDFWRDSFPGQVIDVNYNQLTNAPQEEAQLIFKFCNLDWNDDYLNFHKEHVNSFTFSELQVRQPINTNKQNFSRHYQQELAIFSQFYHELSQDKC